jgi:pumilio RNA-binding family
MPLDLSSGQFSSNVVEKSLVIGDDAERNLIISAIIDNPQQPLTLQQMVNHRYANYVVQRLLDIADQQQKEKCFWLLMDQPTLAQLKKSNFGKHILSKLKAIAANIGPTAVAHFSTAAV